MNDNDDDVSHAASLFQTNHVVHEMHHVRTFFLCSFMTFSYYVMFIHNVFIFKWKANRGFCLP